MWDLPRPGIEPVSPALAGGFLTTSHQGSPRVRYFQWKDFKNWSNCTLKRPRCTGVVYKWQPANTPLFTQNNYFYYFLSLQRLKTRDSGFDKALQAVPTNQLWNLSAIPSGSMSLFSYTGKPRPMETGCSTWWRLLPASAMSIPTLGNKALNLF